MHVIIVQDAKMLGDSHEFLSIYHFRQAPKVKYNERVLTSAVLCLSHRSPTITHCRRPWNETVDTMGGWR